MIPCYQWLKKHIYYKSKSDQNVGGGVNGVNFHTRDIKIKETCIAY